MFRDPLDGSCRRQASIHPLGDSLATPQDPMARAVTEGLPTEPGVTAVMEEAVARRVTAVAALMAEHHPAGDRTADRPAEDHTEVAMSRRPTAAGPAVAPAAVLTAEVVIPEGVTPVEDAAN